MLRILYYILSFLIPPLAVCSVVIYKSISDISFNNPQPLEIGNLRLPIHNNNKLNAVILVGNKGTEISDFLIPYQLLSETGEFNVYAVANHKILSPLNGGIDVLPHYTLEGIDKLLKDSPDLVVIPNIPNINAPDDKPVIEWIRNHNNKDTIILSICEGARVLAETGLIEYKTATTHWSAIGQLKRTYPNTNWIDGVKYVQDGNIISTPGVVTGSVEGTLYVVSKLIGGDKAGKLSRKFGYQSLEMKRLEIGFPDTVWLFTALYPWQKKKVGVYIKNGLPEINLSALLDTYPRSFTADTITFSDSRELIETKNNLFIVSKMTKDSLGITDRIIDPENFFDKTFPFDQTIMDLAKTENKAIAAATAKTLDYRIDHLNLSGNSWPYRLILGPIILGIVGVLCSRVFYNRYLN